MKLIPAEALAAREADFDARREHLPRHYDRSLLGTPGDGRALRYYLILTEMPELLAGEGFSEEQCFWSRYYWFRYYATLRQATAGPDAGLEQQAFQILEHPSENCPLDGSTLKEVEAAAVRDAVAWLRAVGEAHRPAGL